MHIKIKLCNYYRGTILLPFLLKKALLSKMIYLAKVLKREQIVAVSCGYDT